MDDDAAARVLEILDADREELMAFTAELVARSSVTGDEGAAAEFLESWLRDNGFEVERHYCTAADLERWPVYGGEGALESRPSIIATLRSPAASDPPLAINGHIDVVPPGDEPWGDPPFAGVRSDGRICGRGSADMKAGLAAGIFAARAVRRAGLQLRFDIEVQAVIAEESGGLGTLSLLEHRGAQYSGAIVPEPTSSRIVAACGGATPFTVEVDGRAAHISIPWTGVSAFDKLVDLYAGLRELERERAERLHHPQFDALPQKAALAMGVVEAGDWRLTVPASARMLGRIGTLPFERLDDVRAEVAAALAAVAERDEWLRAHPPRLSWDGAGFSGWETDGAEPLVRAMREAAEAIGGDASPAVQTYGCDAGQFAQRGVPVVVVGPGDLEEAHAVDESVAEAEVHYVSRLIGATLARLGARRG